MARMTKKLAPPSLAKKRKKGASALATRLRKQIRARKQAERDAMLPMVIAKPVTKRRKSTTRRKKTTTTAAATSSVISPICRRAGRKLKATASPKAGAVLGSKRCKTKRSGSTTTTAAKRKTTRRMTLKSYQESTSPAVRKRRLEEGLKYYQTKNKAKKTAAKKTTTRKSSAVSKLARIKKIVC